MKTLVISVAEFVRCDESEIERRIREKLVNAGFDLNAPYRQFNDPVRHTITVVQNLGKKNDTTVPCTEDSA